MSRGVDPSDGRQAVAAVLGAWRDGNEPARADVRTAVKYSLQLLAEKAPGRAVEVRVPPFAAVQCIDGPTHTRGTPPNTVQTDPRTWLELATGSASWPDALTAGRVVASGIRSDLAELLPLLALPSQP